MYLLGLWLWLHRDLLLWSSFTILLCVAAVLAAVALHWAVNWDGMLWVQVRRRLHQMCFYATTLRRRRRVPLSTFRAGVMSTYATAGFSRQLTPSELVQLALNAGFPPAAASMLQAAPATLPAASAAAAAALQPAWQRRQQQQQQQQQQQHAVSEVGIPAWRYRYFMWWLRSHLDTLRLLRNEWEQDAPQLICGFDTMRQTADALLFRRPKGICLVRLGQEVGGIIVSLRPDKACLPEEQRTTESYYSSVSAARLVGAAHQLADQNWLAHRRKLREGSVVHVYVPNSSLRLHGGLWGCLRRMRHTKTVLDAVSGEVMPTTKAFKALQQTGGGGGGGGSGARLRSTARQLDDLREHLLQHQVARQRRQQQQAAAQAAAGQVASAAAAGGGVAPADVAAAAVALAMEPPGQRHYVDHRELKWLLQAMGSEHGTPGGSEAGSPAPPPAVGAAAGAAGARQGS